jgi:hypothetical protein
MILQVVTEHGYNLLRFEYDNNAVSHIVAASCCEGHSSMGDILSSLDTDIYSLGTGLCYTTDDNILGHLGYADASYYSHNIYGIFIFCSFYTMALLVIDSYYLI